ncbi:myoneurin-like [Contarinia nasturtii]|uniref:myoneurin-like n=1 Tax=Contarinia nasturtii TaxID=265458 RepID=UPI0012D4851F|nr:myoneurin-like [Contarinia nasturtii]XP_031619105.1 myoneurin-like [Contarinia nasturtii]
METERELGHGTCCLCLSQDESTFHSNSIMKSLPLHEMVNYCIGIQINSDTNQMPTFSTAICNECVLNINNFYAFKKKVLDAQDLVNTLNDTNEVQQDHPVEYVDDDFLQVIELTEDTEKLLSSTENGSANDSFKFIQPTNKLPKPTVLQVTRLVKMESTKKRPNVPSTHQKTLNKKSKAEITSNEKVTIQMNECLICPAVLGDILQLKDHIDSHEIIRCKACQRQFGRYSNLKRHFNSNHSKPKPFQCDICGLAFNFSVNLQTHAQIHYKKTKQQMQKE